MRQITSSRQSPRMSAQRQGFDLVPLFEAQPSAVSSRPARAGRRSHLAIVVPSSSSRSRSPSHQTPKLQDRGLRIGDLLAAGDRTRPSSPRPEAHISYPRWRGSMSIATPRPTSGDARPQITRPVRASRKLRAVGWLGRS